MGDTSSKIYFSYEELHQTMSDLAGKLTSDGHEFDIIVTVASGGYIPARIIKSYINRPIYVLHISFYDNNNIKEDRVNLMPSFSHNASDIFGKRILLVDEIDDTRSTLACCAKFLLAMKPSTLVVAVMHNKLVQKTAILPPDILYYAGNEIENCWACYPWEATDIVEHNRLTSLYHLSKR